METATCKGELKMQDTKNSEKVQNSTVAPGYGVRTFETAPLDGSRILAWHKVWECWMTIKRRDEGASGFHKSCEWIEATLSSAWPSAAFTHWMDCPPAP